MKTKVFLVDDHPVTLEGLRRAIAAQRDMEVVGEARNGADALDKIPKSSAEVVVLDIEMPDMSGILVAQRLAKESKARIIIMSAYDRMEYVHQLMLIGVLGYLLKECPLSELIGAIRLVREGKRYLCNQVANVVVQDYTKKLKDESGVIDLISAREREVLELITSGMGRVEIAKRLCVDPKTIDKHRTSIMQKLGLHSVAELTKFAVAQGITSANFTKRRAPARSDERKDAGATGSLR